MRVPQSTLLCCVVLLSVRFAVAENVDYEREVKPILQARCYSCHGALKQESGLRLDTGTLIRKGGDSGPAAVAEDGGTSQIGRAHV